MEAVFVLLSVVVFVVCDTRTESSPDSGGSLCFSVCSGVCGV